MVKGRPAGPSSRTAEMPMVRAAEAGVVAELLVSAQAPCRCRAVRMCAALRHLGLKL